MDLATRRVERKRDRQQRQTGRKGGHQDRHQAVHGSLHDGGMGIGDAFLHAQPPDMRHQHDAVAGGDAEQRDEANQRRDGEHAVTQVHADHAADERQRQVDHDDEGVARGPERAEQQEEDAGDGAESEAEDEPFCLDLRFELPAVFHAVAVRQRHAGGHTLANVADNGAEVASGDVGRDDDPALAVLAADEVGAAIFRYIGEAAERHACARRHVQPRLPDVVEVGQVVGRVAQHERHRHLPVDNLAYLATEQRGFQGCRGLAGGQTVARQRRPIEPDLHRGDVGLRLQRQVDQPRDLLQRGDGLLAERAQRQQVASENLDRDIGPCPGQHVVDAVRYGLPYGDAGSGHERQALPYVFLDHG